MVKWLDYLFNIWQFSTTTCRIWVSCTGDFAQPITTEKRINFKKCSKRKTEKLSKTNYQKWKQDHDDVLVRLMSTISICKMPKFCRIKAVFSVLKSQWTILLRQWFRYSWKRMVSGSNAGIVNFLCKIWIKNNNWNVKLLFY